MCPVCGYDKLLEPPQDYYICPSCGTEFGNDDTLFTYDQLKLNWINEGMNWFSHYTRPPLYWNPEIQLENLRHLENAPKQTTAETIQEIDASKAFGFVAYQQITSWTDFDIRFCNA